VFDVDLDVDPIFDVDGSAAVGRLLTPSSTKTLVVAYQPMAARGRSTCKVNDGVMVYVPLRCRQGQRLGVNDEVDVDDHGQSWRCHRRGFVTNHQTAALACIRIRDRAPEALPHAQLLVYPNADLGGSGASLGEKAHGFPGVRRRGRPGGGRPGGRARTR